LKFSFTKEAVSPSAGVHFGHSVHPFGH